MVMKDWQAVACPAAFKQVAVGAGWYCAKTIVIFEIRKMITTEITTNLKHINDNSPIEQSHAKTL
jgi:hypothetical protein